MIRLLSDFNRVPTLRSNKIKNLISPFTLTNRIKKVRREAMIQKIRSCIIIEMILHLKVFLIDLKKQ